jgi:hypothetical protein
MHLTNILNPISRARALTLAAVLVVLSACSQSSSEIDARRDFSESVVSDNHVPEVVITASRAKTGFEG